MKFAFAPEAKPLPGYTIKRAIDRGGFGEVYYAVSDSGKEVALKLLQRNQQVELRGVSQCLNLKHPNLVTIFDIKTDADDDHWVVMEYVSGQSLEHVLAEHPSGLPLEMVEQCLNGIAAGIGFLHDSGVVHRDLKPANVFLENGVVKIGDIGLSKFITPSRRSAQTESVGTVYYMAPEVARGKYGSELDVYSLGVMLYEMLTGQVPFTGESTGEILMKHLTEAPDLTKIAAQFRPVLARALEKDPQKRTPGVIALANEFRRALQGKPPAIDIPAGNFVPVNRVGTHFVDVPQVERAATRTPPANGGNATTLSPQANGGGYRPLPVLQGQNVPRTGNPPCTGWQKFNDELKKNPWLAVALVIGFLFIFPRFARGFPLGGGLAIPEVAILGAVAYFVYWAVNKFVVGPSQPANGGSPVSVQPPQPVVAERVVTPGAAVVPVIVQKPQRPVTPPRVNAYLLSPNTRRNISFRKRITELTLALMLGAFWAVGMTGVAGFISEQMGESLGLLSDPGRAGLFAFTTILGAWAVILPAKMWEGTGADSSRKRLILTSLGAAVGACAFGLDQYLMTDMSYTNAFPGLVHEVGREKLLTESMQPTLLGFVLFFAALFGLRRWWWHADSFRSKRFRISSLVLTGLVAYFIPAAFVFPQTWGVWSALAISTVVQLSSRWTPVKDRVAVVEGK